MTKQSIKTSNWYNNHIIFAFMVSLVLQSVLLPCMCGHGVARMKVAAIFDVMILIRIIIALLIKENNNGWRIYCILLCVFPFIILLVDELFLDH